MQRDNFSALKTAPQQSFRPYQKISQTLNFKRSNPYLLGESQAMEPGLHKNLKTENKFVPLLLQSAQQKALAYVNELLAAQLQREYYQNYLANQAQNLNLQLALYNATMDQSRFTTPTQYVKKLESPSKVIVIDDDAHSDSAETNITEGFYCSPKIHITQAEEEFTFEELPLEEEEEVKPETLVQIETVPISLRKGDSIKDQTAEIPKLSLNRKNDQRKRNVRLLWNPETVDRVRFEDFMEELGKILRRRISNEQTVTAILQCFDMDTEKALSTIKRNKAEYQNLFSVSLRNTRRSTN